MNSQREETQSVIGGVNKVKLSRIHHSSSSSSSSSSSMSTSTINSLNSDFADESALHKLSETNGANGKENQNHDDRTERLCFECNRSLSKSRHLINIAGQMAHSWHPECFKCHACQQPLDKESSCHIYKGNIFCRADYAKLQRDNSTKCARCRWPIAASDWVRRAGNYIYHLACFSCDICMRQLSTGEQFTINVVQEKDIVRLLCRLHFAIEPQRNNQQSQSMHTNREPTSDNQLHIEARASSGVEHLPNSSSTSSSPSTPFDLSYHQQAANSRKFHQQHHPPSQPLVPSDAFCSRQYLDLLSSSGEMAAQNQAAAAAALLMVEKSRMSEYASEAALNNCHQQQQHQHQSLENEIDHAQQQTHHQRLAPGGITPSSSSSGASTSGTLVLPSKSKRVRTTFTEDQLAILQTHFNHDSNPDGQELEQIAMKTGLSKRVTQVWFQNSRARQKKYAIKRKPSSSMSNAIAMGLQNNLTFHQASLRASGGSQLVGIQLCQSFNHSNNSTSATRFDGALGGNQLSAEQERGRPKWSTMSEKSTSSLHEVDELDDSQSCGDESEEAEALDEEDSIAGD